MELHETFNPIFQVSEFNELVNNHLALLGEVTIEGEITRLDIKNGRLIFGSIKDAGSTLDIFSMSHLIKNYRQFEPGMLVRVTGTAGLYKQSSRFRLFANSMVPQGEGALQIALEKLKAQLEAEGLFAPERKRPLPKWPAKIGLITAKNSSAYYDLVKILIARMPGLNIKLLPVNVQGREAVPTVLKAFSYTNAHVSDFDVLIMARGGGSLEDLAAFNSEEICRAVFSSKVPVISAIGHEDNWSLTDFVADMRASTPSNAAELVVEDKQAVVRDIDAYLQFINQRLSQEIATKAYGINQALGNMKKVITQVKLQIPSRMQLIKQSVKHIFVRTRDNSTNLIRLVDSLDYQQVLNRGFSITKDNQGNVIKSSQSLSQSDVITTQFSQGEIKSVVRKE